MEVSISSYNETDEQRLIRLLTEQVANQDKLIKKQDEIIEMQKGQIRTRDEQREVFIELVKELIKEVDGWRLQAGQKPLIKDYYEAYGNDLEPGAAVIKMQEQ